MANYVNDDLFTVDDAVELDETMSMKIKSANTLVTQPLLPSPPMMPYVMPYGVAEIDPQQRIKRFKLAKEFAATLGQHEYPKSLLLHYVFSHLDTLALKIADIISSVMIHRIDKKEGVFIPYALINRRLKRKSRSIADIKKALKDLRRKPFEVDDEDDSINSQFQDTPFLSDLISMEHPELGPGVYIEMNGTVRDSLYLRGITPILELPITTSITKKYAWRLYPYLVLYLDSNQRSSYTPWGDIDYIKSLLFLRDKSVYWDYTWTRINSDIMRPTLEHLNEVTPLIVTLELERKHPTDSRVVTMVRFKLETDQVKVIAGRNEFVAKLIKFFEFNEEDAFNLVEEYGEPFLEFVYESAIDSVTKIIKRAKTAPPLKKYFLGTLNNLKGTQKSALINQVLNNEEDNKTNKPKNVSSVKDPYQKRLKDALIYVDSLSEVDRQDFDTQFVAFINNIGETVSAMIYRNSKTFTDSRIKELLKDFYMSKKQH